MEFISVNEASEMLGLSTKTIYRMIEDGRLKTYRAGRKYRISREQVIELLTSDPKAQDMDIDKEIISLFMELTEDKKKKAIKYLEGLTKE